MRNQHPSREAAKECSPRRKPWEIPEQASKAPNGRKKIRKPANRTDHAIKLQYPVILSEVAATKERPRTRRTPNSTQSAMPRQGISAIHPVADTSREAAKESSPRRKPWEIRE